MTMVDLVFQTPIIGCVVSALLYAAVAISYPFKTLRVFVLKHGGDGMRERAFIRLTLSPSTFGGVAIASIAATLVAHANWAIVGNSAHALSVVSFVMMSWVLFMSLMYVILAALMFMAAGGRF